MASTLKEAVAYVLAAARNTGPDNVVQALVFATAQATIELSEYELAQVMAEARAQLKGGGK
jgi:hypothetical protein